MMRRRLILLGILAAAGATAAGAFARYWSVPPTGATTPAAAPSADPFAFVLEHPPVVYRDGNSPATFEVPVANKSAGVVRFSHFGCDCGCTSGRLDRDELQPGEKTTLRMTVNLFGREGPQRFTCH